jgi:arabinan endo-1,5-alpha-L-arabinosidase
VIVRALSVMVLVGGLLVGAVAAAPAAAGPQGSLRAADPTLVRDGDTWMSLSTNERLSSQFAVACDADDPVWDRGFAYIPYRTGPAPDQLGDCYAGDALPGGPGPWAGRPPATGMLQWAPTIARINTAWFLFYAARRAGTGQQCIGVAASDRPTGPGWFHPAQPLICPSGGNWAIDPEIFFDRQTRAWYLLWRQDPGPCDSRIYIQRFNPDTATLTGTARLLLSGTHPDLGFDEYRVTSCPGGLKHIIENPTMVRADSGTLWLFFSANQWDNVNYATGWALCGEGSPTAGGGCALLNSFNPASRNRPWWGASVRTAPTPGNARPSMAFPDLPGLGGLSLATADPTATGTQPVYATAHLFWGGASNLRTQVVLRLDTAALLPALVDTTPAARQGEGGMDLGVSAGRRPRQAASAETREIGPAKGAVPV